MFYRIPMEIIQVALKIQIIPDKMVPEPSLPYASFAALGRRFVDWAVISRQKAALAADGSLMTAQREPKLSSFSGRVQIV